MIKKFNALVKQKICTIRIEEDPTYVTVSVKDRGMGISEENLKTIFDKFSNVPSAGFNKPDGTGLGLAICKAVVEGHDGKIWAEGVKGESSTFYFTLLKKDPRGVKDHFSLWERLSSREKVFAVIQKAQAMPI